ncbi:baseplate J/gp47 family protein [Paenisporosarcina sp. NPDC076898]|uniref:baseplate J/gp47 family protein n=1 Tax=unclassified Paenisporosarcina TaxID=2642018 RepID=UPI003D00245A
MIERLYTNETEDSILERMKERISDDIDKRQGSVIHDALSPASFEITQAYVALDDTIALGLNVTADTPDDFVDLKVSTQGITRKPSIQAIGQLTFTGEDGTLIPNGTRVRTDEVTAIYFLTTAEGVLSNGTVTVPAIAEIGGANGNVHPNSAVVVLGDLTGVSSVTNPVEFIGGTDREDNQPLLNRYYEKVRRPATSGNVYQYEQWAKEIPGVGDVKVYPIWNGAGTVKLVLLDDAKTAPDAAVISDATAYIESVRPIGADVTIVGATELPINVSATLTLTDSSTVEEVLPLFNEGLVSYLQSIAFTGELIRYTRIASVLLEIPDIVDYSNLLLNGATANITPTNDQVGVIGTVNFT